MHRIGKESRTSEVLFQTGESDQKEKKGKKRRKKGKKKRKKEKKKRKN